MLFYILFFNLLGIFVFLFLFWKKTKEDYTSSQIFSVSFLVLFGLFVSFLASSFYLSNFWFWSVFAVFLIVLLFSVWRLKLRFFETYEAALISVLPWFSFIFLLDAMKTLSWFSFAGFIFIWLLILLYVFLNLNYKQFSWYKSGKVGFSGLSVTIVFFLSRFLVACFFPSVLSFAGGVDKVLSAAFAFLFFLLLLFLAR